MTSWNVCPGTLTVAHGALGMWTINCFYYYFYYYYYYSSRPSHDVVVFAAPGQQISHPGQGVLWPGSRTMQCSPGVEEVQEALC